MGYALVWARENIDNVAENYNTSVSQSLEKTLKDKERQLSWVERTSALKKRFHNIFKLDGLLVAEVCFTCQGGEYRALCIVIPEKKSVIYYTTVPKKGSLQQRRLDIMRDRSNEILNLVRRELRQDSS